MVRQSRWYSVSYRTKPQLRLPYHHWNSQEWVSKRPYIVQRIVKESLDVVDAIDEFEYISTH